MNTPQKELSSLRTDMTIRLTKLTENLQDLTVKLEKLLRDFDEYKMIRVSPAMDEGWKVSWFKQSIYEIFLSLDSQKSGYPIIKTLLKNNKEITDEEIAKAFEDHADEFERYGLEEGKTFKWLSDGPLVKAITVTILHLAKLIYCRYTVMSTLPKVAGVLMQEQRWKRYVTRWGSTHARKRIERTQSLLSTVTIASRF